MGIFDVVNDRLIDRLLKSIVMDRYVHVLQTLGDLVVLAGAIFRLFFPTCPTTFQ